MLKVILMISLIVVAILALLLWGAVKVLGAIFDGIIGPWVDRWKR